MEVRVGLAAVLVLGCDVEKKGLVPEERGGNDPNAVVPADEGAAVVEWVSLVPEEGMGEWKSVAYGGEGEVAWSKGLLRMDSGAELTGVRWEGDLPELPY